MANISIIEALKKSAEAGKNYTDSSVSEKQDKLIAGSGVVIGADGKTISATGGGGGGSSVVMTDNADGGIDLTVDGTTKTLAKEEAVSELNNDLNQTKADLNELDTEVQNHETRIEALEQGGGGGGSVVTIADNPNGGVDITVNGNKRTVAKESDLSNLVTTDTFNNKTTSIENDIDTIDDTVSTMSDTLVTVVATQTEHTQEIADLFGIIGGIDDILGSGVFE